MLCYGRAGSEPTPAAATARSSPAAATESELSAQASSFTTPNRICPILDLTPCSQAARAGSLNRPARMSNTANADRIQI